MVKTLKSVTEQKWLKFKSLAAEKNVRMGELFGLMVDEYSKHSDDLWNKILSGKKILSEKDAVELEKVVKDLRKEKGFRI